MSPLANFREARAEIVAAFAPIWTANAVNGGVVPSIHWEGQPFSPPKTAAWVRFSMRHTLSEQASLSGAGGTRRYEKFGTVFVQVFTPLTTGSLVLAEELAAVAKSAFEGVSTVNGIWFTGARISEVGPDSSWFQMNVSANFRYDEIV